MRAKESRREVSTFFIVRNNPNFASAVYSACTVYTKTIIHLSVVESGKVVDIIDLLFGE